MVAQAPVRGYSLTALYVLDYTHAPAIAIYFTSATVFGICNLQKRNVNIGNSKRLRLVLILIFLQVITYLTSNLLHLRLALHGDSSASQHSIIHVLGSALIWICIGVALLGNKAPLWHPYLGSFVLGFFFETAIFIVSRRSGTARSFYGDSQFMIQLSRILISFMLLIDGCLLQTRGRIELRNDEEGQNLLGNGSNSEHLKRIAMYGTVSQESDGNGNGKGNNDDDDNKDIREQQRRRLEEQGGWLNYLKGFSLFLPYLWPKENKKVQLCLLLLAAEVIVDRFVNVLLPRQIGSITNALSTGNGIIPWKDISFWLALKWWGTFAGFGVVSHVARIVAQNYTYQRISNLAFEHVMDLSLDFHSNKDSGEVIKSVDQAQSLNDLLSLLLFDVLPIFLDLAVALWYIPFLFGPYVGFIVLVLGISYIWSGISLTAWAQPKRRTFKEKSRMESKTLLESVSNWQTVSYFNRVPYERYRYGNAVQTMIDAEMAWTIRSFAGHWVQSILLTIAFIGVSILAVWQISSGRQPVGTFVTLITYWNGLMYPLTTVSDSYRHISSTLIDAERLLQLLHTKPTVVETVNCTDLAVKACKVEFKNVDFSYDTRKDVLKNINFVAKPGQTIAFVGETGGGKSTMLKLLFRFYDVTGGSITIDDQDLRSVTISSLREILGAVPQDPSLFNQSILENVRYARLDATDEEIYAVCKAAAVHDKIMSFPDHYHSKVGERGVKLSGGELQRISIARVLLKNPKIVMLDEATSAVDSSTEALIQDAFKVLSKGRTTFVIAHRLSTIIEADLILVVDQGNILERGTHAELVRRGGKYMELWTKQTVVKGAELNKAAEVVDEQDLLVQFGSSEGSHSQEQSLSITTGLETGDLDDSISRRKDGPLKGSLD